ncbi:hypothetical protein JG688_00009632 [Phytophthora aleatoria]|uniref:HAT C-terminal dimerisation domain-containing protein n=1 Tax=Phytophthora aleatoria TaxID=2496075 RepID=A0A8J5J6F6_9STRA|nr:hypothetical protein JG688_00009632 [Phytophthora aleatoria]
MTLSWDANDKANTTAQLREYITLFYSDSEQARRCDLELSGYILLEHNNSPERYDVFTMQTGLEYWFQYGRNDFPVLAAIAVKVLSVPTSSAAAEHVWSAYSLLWSKRRNRMTASTMEKLAFNYVNHGLLGTQDPYGYFGAELDDIEIAT